MEERELDQFAAWLEVKGKASKTIANYGHYLGKIEDGFGCEVSELVSNEERYHDALQRFGERVTGSEGSLKCYKVALGAYHDFAIESREKRNVDLSRARGTWYPECQIEEAEEWWQSLCDYLKGAAEKQDELWVFRGQGFAKWGLETSLGRVATKDGKFMRCGDKLKQHENDSMWEFFREASKDAEFRDFKGVNLLALMQHYGCKTRLLDFSLSPLVALYMALDQNAMNMGSVRSYHEIYGNKNAIMPTSVAIWAINVKRIGALSHEDDWKQFARKQFSEAEIIIESESDRPCQGVTVVFPKMCNRRVAAQDGLFLMPNRLNSSFEENLCSTLHLDIKEYQAHSSFDATWFESGIVKFTFTSDSEDRLRKILRAANVTAKAVYPDLTGLGKYVGSMISL